MGNDYICDTGSEIFQVGLFYDNDPLWDGAGCGPLNACCTFNNPPWFYKELPEPTTDDIEMRVCKDQVSRDEDVPIENIDIYVASISMTHNKCACGTYLLVIGCYYTNKTFFSGGDISPRCSTSVAGLRKRCWSQCNRGKEVNGSIPGKPTAIKGCEESAREAEKWEGSGSFQHPATDT